MRKTHLVVCWLAALLCLLLVGPRPIEASSIGVIEQADITAPFWGPEDEIDTSALETPRHATAGSAWSLMRPASSEAQRIVAGTHLRLDTVQLAQATGEKSATAAPPAAETEANGQSATEVNKQLSNPVTSFWSLQFQFNNYDLENGHWNHNMLFQPVLPVSLTEEWNLINRPVIPVYQSVPHPIGPGRFRQTTAFGDLTDVELLSPAHSGQWLLGLGPTFIFPTGSTYTSQEKYQVGPAAVVVSRNTTSSACFHSSGGPCRAAASRR